MKKKRRSLIEKGFTSSQIMSVYYRITDTAIPIAALYEQLSLPKRAVDQILAELVERNFIQYTYTKDGTRLVSCKIAKYEPSITDKKFWS